MRQIQSAQAGLSVIEAVLSLALMAAMAGGLGYSIQRSSTSLRLASDASQLATFRAAADRYVQGNFTTLAAASANGPIAIPIANLINANYLPPSFTTQNSYQQTYRLYLRRRSGDVLESLALTTGGKPMTKSEGGAIAMLLKAPGGFVEENSPTASGTHQSWMTPLDIFVPSGQPRPSGSPVAYSIHYTVVGPSGSLIRYATGNPVDNRMATDIDMARHDINNVGNLSAGTITASNLTGTTINISGQTINSDDAAVIRQLTPINCAAGYALLKTALGFSCGSAVPSGAVVPFQDECPSGWAHLSEAENRFLVGAGDQFARGDTGGGNEITLTVDQMPAHSHHEFANMGGYYGDLGQHPDAAPNVAGDGRSSGDSYNMGWNNYGVGATVGRSETVGGGQPINIMPSYLALNYCRKQ